MKFYSFLFCTIVLITEFCFGLTFDEGVLAYNNKNYIEANSKFEEFLKNDPDNINTIFNLGIVNIQNNQLSKSLYYFRLLQDKSPREPDVERAIEYIDKKMETKNFQKETTFLEEINNKVLYWLTVPEFLIVQLLLSLIIGLYIVRFVAYRIKIISMDEDPPLILKKHWVMVFILMAINFFTFMKLFIDQRELGTIIYNGKLILKSGPSILSADLNDIYDGFEVKVLQSYKGWTQVSYQNNIIGWVESKYLAIHKNKFF